METFFDDVSAAAYDKAVEVVTDAVRTETRKEDVRMIENTKKWVRPDGRTLFLFYLNLPADYSSGESSASTRSIR